MIGETPTGPTFLCVCLNPTFQKTLVFDAVEPDEVNRTAGSRIDAAGKGICQTRVLTQLGERAINLTQLGGPMRSWFLDLCREDSLNIEWVESGSPIRFCTTVIERRQGTVTELIEEALPVASLTTACVADRFEELLPRVDAVVLAGTVAAGFESGIMSRLASSARKAGKRLYLDLKDRDLLDCLEYNPVVVKPNMEEISSTMGVPYAGVRGDIEARALVARAGKRFHERYGTFLVVTRGSRSTLFWDGFQLHERMPEPVDVLNPIGSGDAFCAGMVRAMETGACLSDAVDEGIRLGVRNACQLKPGSIEDIG